MLWTFTVPWHVRHDYTKLDCLKLFEKSWKDGESSFFGDVEKYVLLRTEIMNPKIVSVHVCGNGLAIRGVLREGMRRVFKEFKFDVVELWTFDVRLVAIQRAAGFKVVAHVPQRVYDDKGKMHDLTVMHYTRGDYEQECAREFRDSRSADGSVQEGMAKTADA